jgi:NADH dehydrogenase [ubiquinone] 1 alpha subcomplex assembly factor 5
MKIFDRELFKLRANKLPKHLLIEANFLKEEICNRNAEKLGELKDNFEVGLEIGSGIGAFYKTLYDENSEFYNPQKIGKLIQSDFSSNFLNNNPYPNKIELDEENIKLKPNSFDIVIVNFALHNVNNPKDVFKSIYNILKPNGAIVLSIPISGSLEKLSEAFFEAEMKLFNGVSPRIHPLTDVKTLGNIVQSAGFKEITVDKDKIEIMFKDFYKIFKDLKNSAQNNILSNRNKNYVGKNFFNTVEQIYAKHKDNQHYPVIIEFANLIAWKS